MLIDIRPDHVELQAAVRDFLSKRCSEEYIREVDNAKRVPEEAWQHMGEAGWLAWPVAERYGGLDGDLMGTVLIVEELCRGFFALGNAYVNSTYAAAYSIGLYGSEELKEEFLPKLATGKVRFAFGFTEPDGGQDILGSIKTRARSEDKGWVINGQKVFTTHANVSDYVVLLARTRTSQRRSEGLTIFLIGTDQPGVEVKVLDTIVFWANSTCELYLSDVVAPAERVVGTVDEAWTQMVRTLDAEKIIVAAEAIGNAQAALDYACSYALDRRSFGRSIGGYQSIQRYLAEAHVRIEGARLMVYKAASLYDQGKSHSREAMCCKLAASEAGAFATDVGMRIMGGYGYMTELPMQRYFRDARVFLTGPVTNEMAHNQIAEYLGMPRSY